MRRLLSSIALGSGAVALMACAATPVVTGGAGGATSSSSTGTGAGGAHVTHVDKIDLLLMVDNSASMADKQQVLATAVPDLLSGLLNPPCVGATGQPIAASSQPSTPTEPCPAGATRLYPPVLDVHVGVISSSLGSFGANGCPDTQLLCPGSTPNTSTDDHGHLLTRTGACSGGTVPTYQGEGFLAWDPTQALAPPGTADLATLGSSLNDLVVGAGQLGCGFESQNEAWYRFLVDPAPYATITLDSAANAVTSGTDMVLLKERQEFLRSDSLLAIVVLTDETDTSIKEIGQYPLFAQETNTNGAPFHLPRGRQECTDPAKGPRDPCCVSCSQEAPPSCPTDPTCAEAGGLYNNTNENLGLRAFGLSGGLMSHKARYGIEFFYQPSRYVQGLTSPTVQDAAGKTFPNPIFSPDPGDPTAPVRDPSLVFYATITGVPWQLIARQDADGAPDLLDGVDPLDPTIKGGFKSSEELGLVDPHSGSTFWDDIAGDPENYVLPLSPFMQESTVPRTGTDPITGIAISPPGSPNGANPINGHEWTIQEPAGDVEYACIFPLATPIDCTTAQFCDCAPFGPEPGNPLCSPNPNDGMQPTLQTSAKAYPGVKNLAIARGLGAQGVVGSICAAQVTDPTRADYGYRPAMAAIVERVNRRLTPE